MTAEPCAVCGTPTTWKSPMGFPACETCRNEYSQRRPEGPVDLPDFRVVTVETFTGTHEEGADPLLGSTDDALIPEGGEVLVYGDGGAGKTTLTVDAVCHLAAGDVWLGITVKRPLQILLIENEGPRPLFRRKLDRKLDAWAGSPLGGRLHILEEPWARFTFADTEHRQALADQIRQLNLDVVVVGPITVAGMDEAGTIQDTRAFQALLADVRDRAGRRVTFILIHHENKGGKVSGAWEGTGDTLLHILGMGHGKTRMHIQKARWAPTYHATTINLTWAEGEGYEVTEKEELDQETIARLIYEYVKANPGTGWTKVEEATPGIARQRRRDIRDQILTAGQIVNVAKIDGVETVLDHVPERKTARLYRSDDPTIQYLRPGPGADGAQTAPRRGERDDAHLRRAPDPKKGAGVGAPDHPTKNSVDGSPTSRDPSTEAERNLTAAGYGFFEALCELCDQPGELFLIQGSHVHLACVPASWKPEPI